MSDRPRILVVDDDAPILLLMKNLLREFGFDPVTAASGEAALAEAEKQPPSLALVDRNMPGMSGDEVIRAMRASAGLATTPVVILSGEPMTAADIQAAGADAAILKPFDLQELLSLVRRLVP
jgi:DNA-binding response OmpR family regulator